MRTDVLTIHDVPPSWIYEFYLGITLQGNTTKAQSPFGPSDRRPSLSIHRYDGGAWVWSDFRAGKKGNAPSLIYEMMMEGAITMKSGSPTYDGICKMIVADYKEWSISGSIYVEPAPGCRWRFSDFALRKWSVADREFWSPFGLGSDQLEANRVAPLDWYAYEKEDGSQEVRSEGIHLYGYFTPGGLLHKIYQPFVEDKKYRKIRSYTEGLDTIGSKKHSMVMSGKKDKMCFLLLGLEFNIIIPDCETSILDLDPGIPVMLDNDLAGHAAMQKYREKGHKCIDMGMEKDFALCVRNHPLDKVRDQFIHAYTNRK